MYAPLKQQGTGIFSPCAWRKSLGARLFLLLLEASSIGLMSYALRKR